MPLHTSDRPDPASIQLIELLGRISAELTELAAAVERLNPLAAALGSTGALSEPGAIRALQSLDLTEQTLRALAGFLADLAPVMPTNCHFDAQDALAKIKLAELASRLKGDATPLDLSTAPSGNCEMF